MTVNFLPRMCIPNACIKSFYEYNLSNVEYFAPEIEIWEAKYFHEEAQSTLLNIINLADCIFSQIFLLL